MLNPTLSDLIGGIQSVTLGDEEARRRRTQKSVLERKAPPTFDVIVEIQSIASGSPSMPTSPTRSTRCCAATRSSPSSAGATRKASIAARAGRGRRRASSSARSGSPGSSGPARRGGWSPAGAATAAYRNGGYREADRGSGVRPGYRPGATGGWRASRGGSGREPATRGPVSEGGWAGTIPGERFASPPGLARGAAGGDRGAVRGRRHRRPRPARARRAADGGRDPGARGARARSARRRGATRPAAP